MVNKIDILIVLKYTIVLNHEYLLHELLFEKIKESRIMYIILQTLHHTSNLYLMSR